MRAKKCSPSFHLAERECATLRAVLEPSGEIRVSKRVPYKAQPGRAGNGSYVAKRQDGAHLSIAANLEKTRKPPGGRGALARTTEFGRAAKRAVKNACGALKMSFGRHIVFATLTLAGSTNEARLALAVYSGTVVELLRKWIRYHAPSALWVYKWEWQKNGALHLHAAIGSDNVLELRSLEKGFKAYVYRLHEQLCRKSGQDVFERGEGGSWKGFPAMMRSNCVPVRKCVKRYMAKYITKAVGVAQGYCPARWWGMSAGLRVLIGAYRRCISIRSRSWELVAQAYTQAVATLLERPAAHFLYSCPFAPSNTTLLYYSLETGIDSAFAAVRSVLVRYGVAGEA